MGFNEDVMEMVRRQLERDPPPPTTALYGRAVQLDDTLYELSLRQFHAKYPLRVKRERAREEREAEEEAGTPAGEARAAEPADGADARGEEASPEGASPERTSPEDASPGDASTSGATPRGGGEIRARLRDVFHGVARDLADAEGRAGLVDVVDRLPGRVDEVEDILSEGDEAGMRAR